MKRKVDLLSAPIDSSLRKFALPLAFSFLINTLYSLVDLMFISKLGTAATGALGISQQLWFFIFTIGSGFAIGTGVIVARRFGEGNYDRANSTASQAVVMMASMATVIATILYFSIPLTLNIMEVEGEMRTHASSYLSAIIMGIPFNYLVFQLNAIIRSTGNSMFPMKVLITSALANAIYNPILIFGIGPFPELGIYGAGLGTAMAQLTAFSISIYGVYKGYTPIKITIRKLKIELKVILNIIKIGFPATLLMLSVSLNRIFLFTIANLLGEQVVAAYTIGINIDLLVWMNIFAMGTAVETTTGQNIGAKKIDRVFAYYLSGIKQISILMFSFAVIMFVLGPWIITFFTEEPIIISKTYTYLKYSVLSYIPFAIGILSTRVISGAGDPMRSLIIVVTVFSLQLPIAYYLSNFTSLAEEGIWISILISQVTFALVGRWQVYSKKWLGIEV